MALENIFSCPKTLARLQGGPLGTLLEGFCRWLMDCGFSRWTIRSHVAYVSRFNAYLGTVEDPPRESVTARDVEDFLRAYPLLCRNCGPLEKHLRSVRWAINRFIDYLRQKGLFEQSLPSPLYQPLLDAYRTWMQQQRRVAAGTLALRCHSLSGFLRRLGTQATVEGLAHLSGDQVERLFLAQARGMGQASRRSLQSAVRTFLRFCLARGYIRQPLDQAVPTLRTYRLSSVPRAWSEEQAQKILEAVEYLQQGRPACACPQVFLTARAPYRCLRRSSNVAQIVRHYAHKAGIDAPPRGAHAFRHAFATRMLRQGHSLKAIADVLGHRRLSTTFGYTKVDFDRLEEVALAWPLEAPTC